MSRGKHRRDGMIGPPCERCGGERKASDPICAKTLHRLCWRCFEADVLRPQQREKEDDDGR